MAIAKDNSYDHLRGKVDDTIIVKHYPDKIVITGYTDRSHIVPTQPQLNSNLSFGVASRKVSKIMKSPKQKKAALERLGCTPNKLYHTLLKELFTGSVHH